MIPCDCHRIGFTLPFAEYAAGTGTLRASAHPVKGGGGWLLYSNSFIVTQRLCRASSRVSSEAGYACTTVADFDVLGAAAVAGSVDSGKSTLVAALTHGNSGHPFLDNGRGTARMAVSSLLCWTVLNLETPPVAVLTLSRLGPCASLQPPEHCCLLAPQCMHIGQLVVCQPLLRSCLMTYTDAFYRLQVFKHKHEIESGRTSSLSHQLLGYSADGKLLQMYTYVNGNSCSLSTAQRGFG